MQATRAGRRGGIVIENHEPNDNTHDGSDARADADRRASGSMRKLALTGGRWQALEGFAIQGLQVVSTMVLARLLTPDDFGIVAVVTLVLVLFGILTDLGFGASVVRRDSVDQSYLSSMFWASSMVGIVASLAAAILAPVLASLAGNPDAAPYLAVASVTLAFGMTQSVPRAILERAFRFRDASAAAVLGFAGYLVIAIALAATTDLGAWAIVLGRVANSAITMAVRWFMSRFAPSFEFSLHEIQEDIRFNAAFLGMRGSQYLAKNVDYWYVGWAFSPAALGTYYIAYVLPNLLRRRMTTAISGPLFITVSGFAADRGRVARAYLGAIGLVTLGAYPVLIGMALVSDELIRVAFGTQWIAAIQPAAILSVGAAIEVIGPAGSSILTAIGMPSRNTVVNLAWAILTLAGLALVASTGSLTNVAIVVLVTTLLSKLMQIGLLRGPLDLRWSSVANSVWPATAASVFMTFAVLGCRQLIDGVDSAVVRLAVLSIVGAAAYVGFGFLAFRKVFAGARGDLRTVFRKA